MTRLEVARPADPLLARLLEGHTGVALGPPSGAAELEFVQDGRWRRSLAMGSFDPGVPSGLVELMDNNPLVCADRVRLPGPAATLALVALGPLLRAGLLLEAPALVFSFEPEEVEGYLPFGDVAVSSDPQDLGGVLAVTALAVVAAPDDWEELDGLYEEVYGRSFYVRRAEEGDWHVELVRGYPWAAYRLGLTPDDSQGLLRIQAMADAGGKAGACQMVHALNVMAGFEECLGIPAAF